MKYFVLTILLIVLANCSFDNKSGIWTNTNTTVEKKEKFKDFKNLYTKYEIFNKTINPNKNLKVGLNKIVTNLDWNEKYYQNSNNLINFSYDGQNEITLKSKRLSKYKINDNLLFHDNKVITSDLNGNIIVYSIDQKKIIINYNFYKKKYKNISKKLNIISENKIIYVSDNIGYLYALNIENRNLLWAKNYKIPFRSNLKIIKKQIVLADTNNDIYFINKENGERIKTIPTEESALKNQFINSFAFDSKSLLFLNTYGSLYSISKNGRIRWFLNLNPSSELSENSLFFSNTLILHNDKIIVSTDPYLYIFNSINGLQEHKITIPSKIKPIISGNSLFLITKNNLFVCLNINNGKINYSLDLNQKIADFLNSKKKTISVKSLAIVNNNLIIFTDNSYVIKFTPNGNLIDIRKLPDKLNSSPIFVSNQIYFTNFKNKLVSIN